MKVVVFLSVIIGFIAQATLNVYDFDDNSKAIRFNGLIKELRCPKCQNNNLADSNAPLATDIKNYVYQSVKAGKSDDEITSFLISRYGEFITYKPRNIIVWLLPTLIGGLALLIAIFVIYRKRQDNQLMKSTLPTMATIIREYEQEKSCE